MIVLLAALWFPLLVICKVLFSSGAGFYEGEKCSIQTERLQGVCAPIVNCSWALKRIRKQEHVDICSYMGKHSVICCPLDEKLNTGQQLVASVGNLDKSQNSSSQQNISSSIAWSKQKCLEYYPAKEGVFIVGVGGERSLAQEFPHMAILGFGDENQKEWKCGGSLISHKHILTAAHCLYSRDLGYVKYVRLGDLDIANDTDEAEPQDFNVKMSIPHPDYDQASLKHDIAILVLDKEVTRTKFVKPACLFDGGYVSGNEQITATGWGITEFAGEPSSHLIKVHLKLVDNAECRRQYRKHQNKVQIDEDLQVCAGSADDEKIMDTCSGDSGGPLQMTKYTRQKHYLIIGITSFGKACGITRSAGVYTRVLSHLPWIQDVVSNN